MSQASDYLNLHLVDGTTHQIKDLTAYFDGLSDNPNFDTEYDYGNGAGEIIVFKDGSKLKRCGDEAWSNK